MIKLINMYIIVFLIICIIGSLAIQIKINGLQEGNDGSSSNELIQSVNTISKFSQTMPEAQKKLTDASANVITLTNQVQNTRDELSQAKQNANKAAFDLEQAKQTAITASSNAQVAKQLEITAKSAYNALP